VKTLAGAGAKVFTVPSSDGLWSTAADLARFGATWSSLLPAELVEAALTPQAARRAGSTGLGWLLDRTGELAGIPGVAPGSSASLVVRVRDGRTQVALSNRRTPVESVNGRVLRALD
jgi:CubicO group peptidase (beta-lactamase class C family)